MTTPTPATLDLSKYVETRLMGDRPHVRGRRLPVTFVAKDYFDGKSIAEIMEEYAIAEEQVLAAILFYREHQQILDAHDAEEVRLWQEMRDKYGRRLDQS